MRSLNSFLDASQTLVRVAWARRGRPEPPSTSRRREATAPMDTSALSDSAGTVALPFTPRAGEVGQNRFLLAHSPWRGWLPGGWAGRGRPEPPSTSRRREATAPMDTSALSDSAGTVALPFTPRAGEVGQNRFLLAHSPWRGWLPGGWAGRGRPEPPSTSRRREVRREPHVCDHSAAAYGYEWFMSLHFFCMGMSS